MPTMVVRSVSQPKDSSQAAAPPAMRREIRIFQPTCMLIYLFIDFGLLYISDFLVGGYTKRQTKSGLGRGCIRPFLDDYLLLKPRSHHIDD